MDTEKDTLEQINIETPDTSAASDLPAGDTDSVDDDYSYPLSYFREDEFERREYQQQKERAGQEQDYYRSYQPPPPPPQRELRPIPCTDDFSVVAIIEAAMMIAISLVLAVVSLYVPVLTVVGSLLYPLPLAMLVLRRSAKVGFSATAVLFILSSLLFGWLQALLMLVQYGAVGLLMGYGFRKKISPITTLAAAVVLSACGTVLDVMLSVFVSGIPIAELFAGFDVVMDEYLALMAEQGLADQIIPPGMTAAQYADFMKEQMIKLLPGALILASMAMTSVLYLVSSKILRYMRYDVPQLPKFVLWRMDWRWCWGVILGLALQFAGLKADIGWLGTLGINLLYVFCPLLALCGLSFALWYSQTVTANPILKVVMVVMLLVYFRIMVYLLILIAVIDSVYDLRSKIMRRMERIRQEKEDEDSFKL